MQRGEVLRDVIAHQGNVYALVSLHDGRLVSSSADCSIKVCLLSVSNVSGVCVLIVLSFVEGDLFLF